MCPDTPTVAVRLQPHPDSFEACTDRTLLESLELANKHWPASCRVGHCRTCLGRIVTGQVHYKVPWPGLSIEEKAAGFVLPCVAFARTDVVLADPFAD